MKPQARIQSTIDILGQSHAARVPMDRVVGDYMRVRRYIGAKDRSDVAERVYNVMRSYARLGWWINKAGLEDTPRARVLAYLILADAAHEKRLRDLCDGSKYAPEPLDETEENAFQSLYGQTLDCADMPEAVRVECPPQYESSLRQYFGDKFADEMQAMQTGAPLDMRVNTFLADKEKVKAYLEAAGIESDFTPYSPWGIRARGKAFLSRTKAFAKGWLEIQDEGSQLIAVMCDAKPGMQVLDFCAGAGGKTLALAAAMQRKGRIVAMDNDERRLMKGKERYKKAGIADIIEIRPLSDARHAKWLKRQDGKFDIVLCDVPCTGTGTWRRNPDMRWRTFGPTLEELCVIQGEILDRVAHCVKPGGRLVYATCSLLAEENENQVMGFLKRHDGWDVVSVPNKDLADDNTGQFMRLTPRRHNTDGFFTAVLTRKD